ncbi:MAG TPA: hypothetical protein VHL53_13015 [Acidimicrobiia bacterium]|nr:hypothetical protein [Acidimicrobiia bacterium]
MPDTADPGRHRPAGASPTVPAEMFVDRRVRHRDPIHRLTARLVSLDLDPATVEILTAVINADVDLRSGFAPDRATEDGRPVA